MALSEDHGDRGETFPHKEPLNDREILIWAHITLVDLGQVEHEDNMYRLRDIIANTHSESIPSPDGTYYSLKNLLAREEAHKIR